MKVRRRARVTVLQTLFEIDVAHHDPDVSLRERLDANPLPASGVDFCQSLLYGVLDNRGALDVIVQRIAPEWPLDQIAPVDRNILRLAAYEIIFEESTPPKVAINEAVELAKMFGSDSSSRFVNGVLGTLYAQRVDIVASLKMPAEGSAASNGSATFASELYLDPGG